MKCEFIQFGPGIVRCKNCGLVIPSSHPPEMVHATCKQRDMSAMSAPKAPFVELTLADLPCVHRSDEVRRVGCKTCSGNVQLKVFKCDIHGECTVHKKIPEIRACVGCVDRKTEAAESPLMREFHFTEEPHVAPKVSIVIAARNNAKYLEESITSALSQSEPCEVIYSDDCSFDTSLEIARGFESRGVTILARQRHGGVCAARNAGADAAHGEYLIFLDGDDVLPVDYVEKQLAAMQPGTPFVYGNYEHFGDSSTYVLKVNAWDWGAVWEQNFVHSSMMIRRGVFDAVGRWREHPGTMWDWDLALRAARLGEPLPSQAVLKYRRHRESWTTVTKEREGWRQSEIMPVVRQLNARLSLGAIVSGRLPGLFPRWMSQLAGSVENMQLAHKPELVILDNSQDMRHLMERECDKYADVFSSIRVLPHNDRFTYDSEQQRRDRVACFMARASNRLRRELKGDVHWTIEDDVLVPRNAGLFLWRAVTCGYPMPHAVAGCYRNRHVPAQYIGGHWSSSGPNEIKTLTGNDPIKVDYTGTGCLMFWKDRTPADWRSHVHGVAAHDWEWGMRLKANGGLLYMLPSVRCGHAVTETSILEA